MEGDQDTGFEATAPVGFAPASTISRRRRILAGATLLATGAVVGVIVSGTLSAGAATTPSPGPSASSGSSSGEDPHPGDNGADGVPEAQEHHGGGGFDHHGFGGPGRLDLSGTVTTVGTNSVTIKTATATTTYAVNSASDIDKNGEASLSDLKAGDAVTFSVTGTTIDRLHAGNEALDRPARPAGGPSDGSSPGA